MKELIVRSPSFNDGERIPKKYTGFAEDISPGFILENILPNAESLVIIMDDLDVPFRKRFNHWLIWNLPVMNEIPENIPYGAIVKELDNAYQGVAYGKNRYRGPKIPFFLRKAHRYVFEIYVLDTKLDLLFSAEKKQLLKAMEKHIIQTGRITGIYKRS